MREHPESASQAALVAAIDDLIAGTGENVDRLRIIEQRLQTLRQSVAAGEAVAEVVRQEDRPLIVELITQNIEALHTVGARLRWAEASALRAEGLTVTAIADLFGVSRQRVSALLQDPPKSVESSAASLEPKR